MTFEDDLLGKLAELEHEIQDLKYELALYRQRIAKLEAMDHGCSSNSIDSRLKEILYEQALDRQRIAKLESYLHTKNNGHRRDFDFLAVELRGEVLRRGKQGMDYKDVRAFSRFKCNKEAYRLMNLTAQLFHEEVRLSSPLSTKQKKKIIPLGL